MTSHKTQELATNIQVFFCTLGCLSTSTVSRRLVTDEVWKRLRFYFPEAPEFSWRQTACSVCNVSVYFVQFLAFAKSLFDYCY